MTVYIVRRETKTKGTRWHVRCELPPDRSLPDGRRPIIHLGVFDTERRAKLRRDAALDELARGQIPTRLRAPEPPRQRTVAETAAEWLATRHDIAPGTRENYTRGVAAMPDWLASKPVESVTYEDVQRLVTSLAALCRSRGTIENEILPLRSVLDYALVAPNPTRDRRLRLPRAKRKAYRLPTLAQIALLHEGLPQFAELMILLEHTGLRISEAAALRWRDIDHARGRLLVAGEVEEVKTAAARRWVDRLPGTPPFPSDATASPEARVFVTPSPLDLTTRLGALHRRRGYPRFSAHDFRHLHASRLLHQGILSPAQIAARLGHADPGVTLKIYSHVVPPED